jgi:hypothetical protein
MYPNDPLYQGIAKHMDKRQQLDLMDKVQRELNDLNNSQTSVLKKLSQIAAHNITLGAALLDDKLPDLEEKINASLTTTTELSEAFGEFRNKFYTDNNLAASADPTA